MGVCSTRYITRHNAQYEIIKAVANLSNSQLEDVMYILFGGKNPLIDLPGYSLANFQVVDKLDQYQEEHESIYGYPYYN